ncbi:MAG TPA: alpha/beta fold hydrolase [Dehalococcoidia bacterium]|nr:alpha/beta fold hydrolase [Dehalococcoidia bacterium]
MATFVLVHGAWHGAWCWDKLVPLLEEVGHRALPLDLPGHGRNSRAASEVTLQAYVDHVCQALDEQPRPAVLVGHSMGGVVITQAAELRPDKISCLVYLSAFLPANGQSLSQLSRANANSGSLVTANLVISEDRSCSMIKGEAVREVFYHDCEETDVEQAKALLCPQPMAPLGTPVTTNQANFGRVPRVYIECLQDQALPLAYQRQMQQSLPCSQVLSLDTGHSPFFSAPEELAALLVSLV